MFPVPLTISHAMRTRLSIWSAEMDLFPGYDYCGEYVDDKRVWPLFYVKRPQQSLKVCV